MDPCDRYDSLFQFYSAMNLSKGKFIEREIPLDWQLLKRQAIAESDLNPDAVSRVGAKGLMQFMDRTWTAWVNNEFGSDAPPRKHINQFDPEDSISAAADMMSWLLRVHQQDVRKALSSYNWGIGNVTKCCDTHGVAWEAHLPLETRRYLKTILG